YVASPWVDRVGGPRNSGYIMQSGDLARLAAGQRERMQLYDRIVFAPPVGADDPQPGRYLAYRLGPYFEDFGQIVIPTGVIEVTRQPQSGEAGFGRVVQMFGEVVVGQRLIPYDSVATIARDASGESPERTGKVRWILNEPELPSLQSYLIIDITKQE